VQSAIESVRNAIWGPWLIVFILGTGLYLTIRLRGVQFFWLGYALKLAVTKRDDECEGDISHFQALMTALAATIGIGNIAGVATALATGGVGALFWMVIAALIGMATIYSEAFLAIRFRHRDKRDEMAGGPMYYIAEGLKWKWLAGIFAGAGAVAALATGNMVQANSITDVLFDQFGIERWLCGLILAALVGLVLLGGIRNIGRVAGVLVPLMAILYLLGGLMIILLRLNQLPDAIALIFGSAFTGQAAVGGFLGSTIMLALRLGVSRGLFASEAGLGSSPIAAAAARTDTPGRQALINMTGAFISVCIICTITGLSIAVTHVLATGATGVPLTVRAFDAVIPHGRYIVMLGAILFGYSTMLGWAYYGERCTEYLFHERSIWIYRTLFVLVIIPGAMMDLHLVWSVADIANAFMAVPNLIGLLGLSGLLARESRLFIEQVRQEQLAE
jgi:alanine or glycine:cation symporter, AGCS family